MDVNEEFSLRLKISDLEKMVEQLMRRNHGLEKSRTEVKVTLHNKDIDKARALVWELQKTLDGVK